MTTIFKHKVLVTSDYNGPASETVVFNDPTAPQPGSLAWGIDVMEGWKTSPDVEASSVELGSYRDGVSPASFFPVRRRFLTLGGYAYAATEADAEGLHDWLLRWAFPRNSSIQVARYEAIPKQVVGRRSSGVEVDWSAVQTGFRWQTTLMCEDPLKYSLTSEIVDGGVAGTLTGGHTFPVTFPHVFDSGSAGGYESIGANNAGTAYSPNFTALIVGYLGKGAWRLQNDTTGEYIGFDVAVQTTDILVIDFKNQVALLNGYPISSAYYGTFWKMAPGANAIRLYAEYDANAHVTIQHFSAWE